MPKKILKSDLGRALANRRDRDANSSRKHANSAAAQIATATGRHTVDLISDPKLQSILDATDLEELMLNATMANKDFTPERYSSPLVPQTVVVTPLTSRSKRAENRVRRELDKTALRIPRRPPWDATTTYEQLMTNETEQFLKWRRKIASTEEDNSLANTIGGAMMTPFEKNLEVWRQLWRVVERSDVVVQIVDARNPLLYYCEDMYRYVTEDMNRSHLLLMNKSDLLSPAMITKWSEYFERHNIDAVFFSAFNANVNEASKSENVIGVPELVEKLGKYERRAPNTQANQRLVVGMCGYPNVGKSSTINVLLETLANIQNASEQSPTENPSQTPIADENELDANNPGPSNESETPHLKRVAVSSTPGKTKHFQTLVLTDSILLCDCPGLVFPNFSSSKAELICASVLSIDTMRGDHVTPVSLIAERIPAATLEGVYGLRFPDVKASIYEEPQRLKPGHVSGSILLDTHARARGYMSDHDKPDQSRSARVLLKDFVSGRIIFAHGPPGNEGESGIGPDVFAKKGQLVYARTEARKEEEAAREKEKENGNGEAAIEDSIGSSKAAVRARVSGRKKHASEEFVRVKREFFNPQG